MSKDTIVGLRMPEEFKNESIQLQRSGWCKDTKYTTRHLAWFFYILQK